MPAQPTPSTVLRESLLAVRQYGGITQAAKALGLSYGTFQHRVERAKAALDRGDFALTDEEEDRQAIPKGLPFEREWRTFQDEIGAARDRYTGPAKPKARTGRLNILVVPDLHAPFQDKEAVASMLEREQDIDICVVMGDIGDSYSLSRFLKYESCPYEEELASVTLMLQTFSERFPIVRVIEGNHDAPRLEKQLLERLSKDMVTAIRSMTGGTLDPIEAICKRFPNFERKSPTTVNGHKAKWMTQIGDAIFAHAEKFSRVPGSALRSVDEWLTDMEAELRLDEFRVVVQAHTHQLGFFPWKADRWLVECGCLCVPHGYQIAPKIGGRPQRRGWVRMTQIDGVTDINSIRLVSWDAEQRMRT